MKRRSYTSNRPCDWPPRWLYDNTGRVLFGWMLAGLDLKDGRLTVTLFRQSSYRYTTDCMGRRVEKHRVYARPGLLASLRFLWMLARSRRVDDATP